MSEAKEYLLMLEEVFGREILRYDEHFLLKNLRKRQELSGVSGIGGYLELLRSSAREKESFRDALRVSYSSFFRNSLTFEVLRRIVLPKMFMQKNQDKQQELRIWSAACSAGQEAYSLAMICDEQKACNNSHGDYRIFATDSDARQLELARKGKYRAEDVDNVNMKFRGKWLTEHRGIYTVKPELKNFIEFSLFDLFDAEHSSPPESIFGNFKLIFCANLLFYYKDEFRSIIIQKIRSALAADGFVVCGETERDYMESCNFTEVFPYSAIFKRNNKGQKK